MCQNAPVMNPTRLGAVLLLALGVTFSLDSRASASTQEGASKAIEGVWIYANDPSQKIKVDPVYEGSTITIEAGGRYAFALGGMPKPLQGTWELRGAEGYVFRIHTEYGQGRKNDLTLTLRRDGKGVVTGMEVREGDGSAGARYYVPQKK